MNGIQFPHGFRLETLRRTHPRREFCSGQNEVDDWLATKALQNQNKHLSITKALLDPNGTIAGFYTLATGQVDFGDLPDDIAKRLPRRMLPVAILAWLGIDQKHQRKGLGKRLLAQALRDCYSAGRTFAFVAVIIDCVNDQAKLFYKQWNFRELPGRPYRLYVSSQTLDAMMEDG